jgi:hypothetical protein
MNKNKQIEHARVGIYVGKTTKKQFISENPNGQKHTIPKRNAILTVSQWNKCFHFKITGRSCRWSMVQNIIIRSVNNVEYNSRDESVRSTSVRSKRQGDQRGWEG